MSEYLGGFCARLPEDADPLRVARLVRDALELDDLSPGETFLVLRPGAEADSIELEGVRAPSGREAFDWYCEHDAVPRLLSRELGVIAYAWAYENQVGREQLRIFERGGEVGPADLLHWENPDGRPREDWPIARIESALGRAASLKDGGPGGVEAIRVDLAAENADGPELAAKLAVLRAKLGAREPGPAPGEAQLLEKVRAEVAGDEAFYRQYRAHEERNRARAAASAKRGTPDPVRIDGCFAGIFAGLVAGALAWGGVDELAGEVSLSFVAALVVGVATFAATFKLFVARQRKKTKR